MVALPAAALATMRATSSSTVFAVVPPGLAVAAAVMLGGVFVVSSIAKLASPSVWYAQADGMGVPRPVAVVVPYVEAVLAGWLVSQWRRPVAAAGALVVLVAFSALVAVRLAQGRRPVCACFGALSARPIGVATLVRNALFVVLAVVALG